jgi:hypothetical protein
MAQSTPRPETGPADRREPPGDRLDRPRRRPSMAVVNFWLDASLMLALVALGGVSAMLRIVFPCPTRADGWRLWGWDYDQWTDLQFGLLCVLGLGVVVHVMLHWDWVCGVVASHVLKTRRRADESMKTIYGVGLLIALLHVIAGGIILAMLGVRPPGP